MALVRSPIAARRLAALGALALLASACKSRGIVAAAEVAACERCHGGNGSAAPPRSARGATETTDRGVGAHRRHLALQGDAVHVRVRAALACDTCHVVPTSEDAHVDGVAEVRMLGLAVANGKPAPAWNPGTGRCDNVYCHGAGFRAGQVGAATAPSWTLVDASQLTCGSCHAFPPASHASYSGVSDAASCHGCHGQTVKVDGTIDIAAGTHIDGTVQAPTGGGCSGCHGAPPDTGAHRVHANPADPAAISYGNLAVLEDVSPSGGTAYDFGCGHCHPTDPASHMNGTPDVVLTPPATPVAGDEIKARNDAAAAFDSGAGTCSGVYCHSSGQEAPTFVATPAWTAAAGALGCGGCHGNPPKYQSGGPGAADANSHVDLDLEQDLTGAWVPTWEFGHFAGFPGADHPSKHGGGDPATWPAGSKSSPITCQACHFDTVDPAKVRAGGFFYFDPDGDYDLRDDRPAGVGLAGREAATSWQYSQCATCHAADLGAGGRVRPLRHVNGKRDVVFDPRTALPDGYATGLPDLMVPEPLRPYYVNARVAPAFTLAGDCAADPAAPSCGVAADVLVRQAVDGTEVIMLTLEHARYDPATKTCSAVACHFDRQVQVESGAQQPLRWGAPYVMFGSPPNSTCTACHAY